MSDTPDLSSLFKMMNEKNIDISSLINNMSSNKDTQEHEENTSSPDNSEKSSMPDMETMMKMAKIMSAMNSEQNNASTNLLYALKPFLRESKKEKVDQYAKFIKMSSLFNEMNKM